MFARDIGVGILLSVVPLLTGGLIATAIATAIGAITNRVFRTTIRGTLVGVAALPSIAWAPLALVLAPNSPLATPLAVLLTAWAPAALATLDRSGPLYSKVVGAARASWAFGWRGLLSAQVLGASFGLGSVLEQARLAHDPIKVVTILVTVFIVAYGAELAFFSQLDRRFEHYEVEYSI